jgi:hypothetical protein
MTRPRPTQPIVSAIMARHNAFVGLLLALVVSGCGSPAASPKAEATASPGPIPTAVVAATPRVGSFQSAAPMNASRIAGTATLLIAGGRVGDLLHGGCGDLQRDQRQI